MSQILQRNQKTVALTYTTVNCLGTGFFFPHEPHSISHLSPPSLVCTTCSSLFCCHGEEDLMNSLLLTTCLNNQNLEPGPDPRRTMKQDLAAADNKTSSPALPAARARTLRMRETPRVDSANGGSPGLKARPKPASVDASGTNVARKSILFNKLRPAINGVGDPKERNREEAKVVGSQDVEQYARLRRRADTSFRGSEDGGSAKMRELQTRLDEGERLLRDSQSEVLALGAQIEKLQVLNVELESQKKKLEESLSAAEAKIKALEKHDQVESVIKSGFSNVMEVVQKKSQNVKDKVQFSALKPPTKAVEVQSKALVKKPVPPLPTSQARIAGPPPPPPPPPHAAGRSNAVHKPSALVELYHSLSKRDGKQGSMVNGGASPLSNNARNSIVGELQSRSSHLLAIKSDVETKGHLIKHLIEKVLSASFTNMEDALNFVDWLDGELSTLADESAVLKHFDWPERKADALREAAFEFRDLKRIEAEAASFKDDASLPCEATLKRISNLLDKLERSVGRLIKLRTASMLLYRDCRIPTYWMLDSGMISKMKQVSVKLAKVYMRRVSMELESVRHSERESAQEALLFEGVRFAYRAHQFAGGLDSETMFIFEELKTRVDSQCRGW
ncbi:hypothetical protein MUK42_19669 [Musa troglodytarum]|uniref:Protein CHUP1, chloroplastic n=2 Tax=Musa troglodytarum TaxID=320322 RepID=A0A9E7K5A4_9LILI|nr:hypothetical protein MUK42_19669 [Musa troglodytarum]